MSDKKIIAVVGATGAQGGALVRAIQADPRGEFQARAITRNPKSDKAKALAELGADVVAADVDDTGTLRRAFEGAHGAFCVTFFWDHFSPEKETAEAGNMAEAARQTGLRHVIWSTLDDSRKQVPLDDDRMPTLLGKYKVPHYDGKAEGDQLFTQAGVPTTFLLTSFYWENFIYFGAGPKRQPDGRLALVMPLGDKKLPGIASEDIGKCALAIFRRGREFVGKTVGIAGGHPTGAEMAAAMSSALGEKVVYQDVPPEVYRNFGFPGADDMGNMFQWQRDFSDYYCGARSIEFTRSLNPELQTFEQWLKQNASRIPIEAAAR
ncbi:MAG TPA: NmrA/HSCARG family protein [Gemmatimonadales bacterium]